MSVRSRGAAFAAAGLAALALSLMSPAFRVAGIVAGVVFLLLAATTLSHASRVAASLRPLLGRSVLVQVWGAPLPGPLRLAALSAFGAGLLIRLRRGAQEKPVLLKVAQPTGSSSEDGGLLVPEAAYVSWAGRRLPRQAGHPAMRLTPSDEPVAAVVGPAS